MPPRGESQVDHKFMFLGCTNRDPAGPRISGATFSAVSCVMSCLSISTNCAGPRQSWLFQGAPPPPSTTSRTSRLLHALAIPSFLPPHRHARTFMPTWTLPDSTAGPPGTSATTVNAPVPAGTCLSCLKTMPTPTRLSLTTPPARLAGLGGGGARSLGEDPPTPPGPPFGCAFGLHSPGEQNQSMFQYAPAPTRHCS